MLGKAYKLYISAKKNVTSFFWR